MFYQECSAGRAGKENLRGGKRQRKGETKMAKADWVSIWGWAEHSARNRSAESCRASQTFHFQELDKLPWVWPQRDAKTCRRALSISLEAFSRMWTHKSAVQTTKLKPCENIVNLFTKTSISARCPSGSRSTNCSTMGRGGIYVNQAEHSKGQWQSWSLKSQISRTSHTAQSSCDLSRHNLLN